MMYRNWMVVMLFLAALLLSACQPIQAPVTAPREYAHPETLASTDWLAANLDDPAVHIVDGRDPSSGGKPEYEAGHISGAVYVDVWNDLSDPDGAVPGLILPQAEFEALMGRLGIDNDVTVVVYDDVGGAWMARLWWALHYYGHDNVKVLNGGLKKWTQEGRPLETGVNTPRPVTFAAHVHPELLATLENVQQAILDPNTIIVNALPAAFHSGQESMYDMPPGHIPTAVNLPAPDNLDPNDDSLLPPEELAQLWQKVGIQPTQHVITYCGAGYFGSLDLFALHQLGHEQFSLYDGSWIEWISSPDLPVEKAAN